MFRSLLQFRLRLPRIIALGVSAGAFLIVALVAHMKLESQLRAATRDLAPLPLHQKNQGLLLLRDAFEAKNVLPVFGSSELTRDEGDRASDVFAKAPTGFQVCPIGSAGNTCLLSLMKIAALGDAVRDKKLAILLSPGWFTRPHVPADHFAGNFSPLHAIRMLEGDHLSDDLKFRIARRLLDYADILEANPALLMRVRSLAQPSGASVVLKPFEDLMLRFDAMMLEYEDDVQSLRELHKHPAMSQTVTPPSPAWDVLLASAKAAYVRPPLQPSPWDGRSPSAMNESRRRQYASADKGEWLDLELLLDTLNELHAQPLIISMPLAGQHDDREGILPATRHDCFYARIQRLCDERQILVRTMEDHDEDPDFLIKFVSHPSAVGWVHIDRLLDDFWHDRLIPTWTTTN